MTPVFEIFYPIGSLFYALSRSDRTSLSAEKISLFLSHLVSEIFGPKFSLIFHQNVLCKGFKHFDPSFLQNRIRFSSNFFLSHAEPGYQTFGEVPPTPGGGNPVVQII